MSSKSASSTLDQSHGNPAVSSFSDTNKINSSSTSDQNKPNDDKSDESDTSITHSKNILHHNEENAFLPHVPLCKTNTSSDDDDYDEIYPIHSRDSSQFNQMSSITRTSRMKKSPRKHLEQND